MDRHLPGAEVGDRRAREWREQGFASEEDMLDWLENRKRVPPGRGTPLAVSGKPSDSPSPARSRQSPGSSRVDPSSRPGQRGRNEGP